jgi:hypothetical protein
LERVCRIESKHVEHFKLVNPGPRRECDAYAVELAKCNRDMKTKELIIGEMSNMDFIILWQIKLMKIKIFLY